MIQTGLPVFLLAALLSLIPTSLLGQVTSDSEVTEALMTGQHLVVDAHRPKEAAPYLEYVIANGEPERRQQAATLLYSGARFLLREPQDLVGATDLLRKAIRGIEPTSSVAPAADYLLGWALLLQVPEPLPDTTCARAREQAALLQEAEQAFELARSAQPDSVKKNLGIGRKYQPRIRSKVKAYCHP